MLIRHWMTKDVVTVSIDEPMPRAAGLMKEYNIRMLPVMKDGRIVGVLSDRDIKRASASDASTLDIHELLYLLDKLTVKRIMTPDPITIPEDRSMDEAAQIMSENKISGLPVTDAGGNLVGIVTMSDVCRTLVSLTGQPKRGILFGFVLSNQPGSIREVTDVIRGYGGRVVSILSHMERLLDGERTVYMRMYGVDRRKLDELLDDLRKRFTMLYMIDYRTGRREISET